MTIRVISERPRRSGTLTLSDDNNDERTFICSSTSPDVYAVDFKHVAGLPRRGDRNPRDPNQRLRSITFAQSEQGPTYFEVTCHYVRMSEEQAKAEAEGGDGGAGAEGEEPIPASPVNLRPEIRWGGLQYEKVCESVTGKGLGQNSFVKHTKGRGLLYSNGEAPDPPFTIDDSMPTVQIRRAERVASARKMLAFIGSINVEQIVIDGELIDSFQAKMLDIRVDKLEYDDGNAPFRWVEYDIAVKDDDADFLDKDWILRPLDIGTYYIDTSGNRVPFLDDQGNQRRGLLNGAGNKVEDGDPENYYLEFHVRKERVWEPLNLPKVSI